VSELPHTNETAKRVGALKQINDALKPADQ